MGTTSKTPTQREKNIEERLTALEEMLEKLMKKLLRDEALEEDK